MQEILDNILKAIKDCTHIYEDSSNERLFIDEVEITRAVLTIFSEYNFKKMEEIRLKLMELEERRSE